MSYASAASGNIPFAAVAAGEGGGGGSNKTRSKRNKVLTEMKNKCQGGSTVVVNSSDTHQKKSTMVPSIIERLQACLENDKIRDLYLVAKDGVRVPALRCLLASVSPVLERMLYGDFVESQQTEVELGDGDCSSKALEALVEFCCSDQLTTSRWQSDEGIMLEDCMAVARLGHTYAIPGLQEAVQDLVLPRLQEDPSLACTVLKGSHPVSTPELHEAALEIIRSHPYVALKSPPQTTITTSASDSEENGSQADDSPQPTQIPKSRSSDGGVGGIQCLPPELLEEILQDESILADELFLFQCLVDWRDHNADTYENANEICQEMVRHIRLACIDPEDLKSTVMTSGFVNQDLLLEAFMEQAITASNDGVTFATLRSAPEGLGHVLVQGAGYADCNGIYAQQRNLAFPPFVYFTKHDAKQDITYYLVKDRTEPNWKISANGTTYYEWKASEQEQPPRQRTVVRGLRSDLPPRTGWSVHLPCPKDSCQISLPTCKFFRTREEPT